MPSKPWIWNRTTWPNKAYDATAAAAELTRAHRLIGIVEGKAAALGLGRAGTAALDVLACEAQASAAIEGESFQLDVVRAAAARHHGLARFGPIARDVEGLVAVIDDATTRFDLPLSEDRLYRWHAALFHRGTSGGRAIAVGRYRDHAEPMRIVSGPPGREVVHYEAPRSKDVPALMRRFLAWFTASAPEPEPNDGPMDGLARAAIAHLWFEGIHPFEDGNGRIGRAIVDLAIAQQLRQPTRFWSLSPQLLAERPAYYAALNQAQCGGLNDVTAWVQWFARQCGEACRTASQALDQAVAKRRFWERCEASDLTERQRLVLQLLLDSGDSGQQGGMNAARYMAIADVSKATATRDLAGLVACGLLWTHGVGKALRYYVNVPGWTHGVLTDRDAARLARLQANRSAPLELAARVASTSYAHTLSPDVLGEALRTGVMPTGFEPNIGTLLDEAPVSLLAKVVPGAALRARRRLWPPSASAMPDIRGT